MRPSQRQLEDMRQVEFIRHFTQHAEGSVLACFGNTKVICTASISEGVPRFLQDSGQGWITAEYGMLPRSTHDRMNREAARGKQSGRTVEIQRLIGRSLRAAVDLKKLGKFTINLDCDVIQADGGTRTTAISGACVALVDALRYMQREKKLLTDPLKHMVAAVSVGIYQGEAVLDLDYAEDSNAHTDMNLVMTDAGHFIELQGTAEGEAFSEEELAAMMSLGRKGINEIFAKQQAVLREA